MQDVMEDFSKSGESERPFLITCSHPQTPLDEARGEQGADAHVRGLDL